MSLFITLSFESDILFGLKKTKQDNLLSKLKLPAHLQTELLTEVNEH